ncbi:hypothetical protein [Variovorax beijingensis]|uniref:hypothetical protein n=1 Tax=Variovorax beijingensis TaxID=2496117 RepID=UPI003F6A03A1
MLLPAGAAAQSFPCRGTPGERQVGMAGGTPGMASFPICVAGPAPGGGRDAMGASASEAASYDPVLDGMVRSVMARQKQLSAEMARQAALDEKLARDPAFRRLHLGAWNLFQARAKARPGETCTAVWSKQGQMVSISGPGPQYEGGMLTFLGRDIPQPADMQTISVTMKQSRYPAQTVKAVNYTLPGVAFGALSLTVPDIEKAIDTMLDVEQFELLIDGKRVSSIGWSGGHDARDKLRRCVHAR